MTLIQVRRGTAAAWTGANPTLDAGEPGLEIDTLKLKVGDGSTVWTSLAYIGVAATPNLAAVLAVGASAGGVEITNGATPTTTASLATKGYVDAVAQGLSIKQSCRLATAAALPGVTVVAGTLVAVGVGVLTIDGQAVALNDRILVKDQVAGAQNGIYTCTTAGASLVAFVLTRATDSDTSAEIVGAFTFIEEGTVNAAAGFVNTNSGTITIGTTAITYTQFSGAGEIIAGAALTKTGNTLDVAVDGTTIVVTTDALNVKAGGIDTTQLANAGGGAAGPTGDSTHVATVTVDAKGRTTALSSTAIVFPPGGLAVYGDGSDGTVTFDGTTTILGVAPSPSGASGVYTQNRDWFFAAMTLNSGITIVTNGFRIFCAGQLANNGTIKWSGTDASGANGSVGGAAISNSSSSINRSTGAGSPGTAGGSGTTTAGAAGTNQSTNSNYGSAGGAGGAGVNAAAAAGTIVSSSSAPLLQPRALNALFLEVLIGTSSAASQWQGMAGGTGGGAGGGDGTNKGGGGGAGGGVVLVVAKTISGTGSILARGGNGGTITTSTLGCGGGGGGGGGYVCVISSSVSAGAISGQTIDANGGTHGTKLGTAGVNGSDGSNGMVVILPN